MSIGNNNGGVKDLEVLLKLGKEDIEEKGRDELVMLFKFLLRVLKRYADKTCGPREAAEIFDRRKSWIYDALSRPKTELQHAVAQVAGREDGGIVFRRSDLIHIRDEIFRQERDQCKN